MNEEVTQFLEYLESVRGYSAETLHAYKSDLKAFFKTCQKPATALTRLDVQSFIKDQRQQGKAPRTINRRLHCLMTLQRFLIEELEIQIKPFVKREYQQKVKDEVSARTKRIRADDAKRLMDVCKPLDSRAYITMLLMGKQGLRLGEVRRLMIKDIDFIALRLAIRGSKGDDRNIPLARGVAHELKVYLRLRSKGPVLVSRDGSGYSSNVALWARVRKWMDKLAVPGSPHSWRRMFGTELYRKTKDIVKVQEMLGHKSVDTTRKSYVDKADESEKDRQAFDEIF